MLQSVAIIAGTGKTHLAIGPAIRLCQAIHRALFATASEWSHNSPTPITPDDYKPN